MSTAGKKMAPSEREAARNKKKLSKQQKIEIAKKAFRWQYAAGARNVLGAILMHLQALPSDEVFNLTSEDITDMLRRCHTALQDHTTAGSIAHDERFLETVVRDACQGADKVV